MIRFIKIVQRWFRSSIKLRIVTVIGTVVSLLMILISIGILLQWRVLILEQKEGNTTSISNAFAIPVIEALIFAEREEVFSGDLLETHIENFMDNVETIRYISIQDNDNRIIAHSDLSLYNTLVTDPRIIMASRSDQVITSTFKDDYHGWIMETTQPLQIGDKRWGTAVLGFDAEYVRAKIANSFFLLLILTVSTIIITLIILYYFINRVMSSLLELVTEVDKIDLNSDQPMTIKSRHDEIGFLIDHFEMLKKRLSQSKQELANAQHQIYQAEKLASIGRLASGIAHEVNNPLNGIRFCVYGIQKDPNNRQQTQEYLQLIDEGLSHIESVVTKLLGYSRQRPKEPQQVDILKQLNIVLELLDYRLDDKNINVEIVAVESVPQITADPNLIQEMLMNLLLNSLDAIDQKGKITVTINLQEPNQLFLSIRDDGIGISEENIKKIYEPFFTTKETGKGTGLGLSVTHGIVEAHNGSINVFSERGAFTEFQITLPLENHESINN